MPRCAQGATKTTRTEFQDSSSGRSVSAADLTPDAVQRAVLFSTLQHPASVYPVAGSLVAALWSVMIAASPASLGTALLLGFVGTSAWVVNFFMRGDALAAKHVHELRAQFAQSRDLEIDDFIRNCEDAGFAEGAKEARELGAVYRQFNRFLDERGREGGGAGAERYRLLAEETFAQGMGTLRKALRLYQELALVDESALAHELAKWQMEQAARGAGADGALEVKINAHQKRIRRCAESNGLIGQLIAQANSLETALETARLELADLADSAALVASAQDGGAALRLEQAVAAARRIEERIRNPDGIDPADRNEYLEAGKRAEPKT